MLEKLLNAVIKGKATGKINIIIQRESSNNTRIKPFWIKRNFSLLNNSTTAARTWANVVLSCTIRWNWRKKLINSGNSLSNPSSFSLFCLHLLILELEKTKETEGTWMMPLLKLLPELVNFFLQFRICSCNSNLCSGFCRVLSRSCCDRWSWNRLKRLCPLLVHLFALEFSLIPAYFEHLKGPARSHTLLFRE